MPEMVLSGPDDAGTVWVKIYCVIDPSQSFCPNGTCGVKKEHSGLPVVKVLADVVWYFEDLVSATAVNVCLLKCSRYVNRADD